MDHAAKRRRLDTPPIANQEDHYYEEDQGEDDIHPEVQDRIEARNRFKATLEDIFEKYGKDFTGVGDEIDLVTGEVLVDNGHLQRMGGEDDVGGDLLGADESSQDEEDEEDSGEDISGQEHDHTQTEKPDTITTPQQDDTLHTLNGSFITSQLYTPKPRIRQMRRQTKDPKWQIPDIPEDEFLAKQYLLADDQYEVDDDEDQNVDPGNKQAYTRKDLPRSPRASLWKDGRVTRLAKPRDDLWTRHRKSRRKLSENSESSDSGEPLGRLMDVAKPRKLPMRRFKQYQAVIDALAADDIINGPDDVPLEDMWEFFPAFGEPSIGDTDDNPGVEDFNIINPYHPVAWRQADQQIIVRSKVVPYGLVKVINESRNENDPTGLAANCFESISSPSSAGSLDLIGLGSDSFMQGTNYTPISIPSLSFDKRRRSAAAREISRIRSQHKAPVVKDLEAVPETPNKQPSQRTPKSNIGARQLSRITSIPNTTQDTGSPIPLLGSSSARDGIHVSVYLPASTAVHDAQSSNIHTVSSTTKTRPVLDNKKPIIQETGSSSRSSSPSSFVSAAETRTSLTQITPLIAGDAGQERSLGRKTKTKVIESVNPSQPVADRQGNNTRKPLLTAKDPARPPNNTMKPFKKPSMTSASTSAPARNARTKQPLNQRQSNVRYPKFDDGMATMADLFQSMDQSFTQPSRQYNSDKIDNSQDEGLSEPSRTSSLKPGSNLLAVHARRPTNSMQRPRGPTRIGLQSAMVKADRPKRFPKCATHQKDPNKVTIDLTEEGERPRVKRETTPIDTYNYILSSRIFSTKHNKDRSRPHDAESSSGSSASDDDVPREDSQPMSKLGDKTTAQIRELSLSEPTVDNRVASSITKALHQAAPPKTSLAVRSSEPIIVTKSKLLSTKARNNVTSPTRKRVSYPGPVREQKAAAASMPDAFNSVDFMAQESPESIRQRSPSAESSEILDEFGRGRPLTKANLLSQNEIPSTSQETVLSFLQSQAVSQPRSTPTARLSLIKQQSRRKSVTTPNACGASGYRCGRTFCFNCTSQAATQEDLEF